MTERELLLHAITLQPADDTARLVYADFLDEQGGDYDTAHAEFIRLSCQMDRDKGRQTPAEGAWLVENWQRLLPSVAAAGFVLGGRNGRWLHFHREDVLVQPFPGRVSPRTHVMTRHLSCDFWRGFVDRATVHQVRDLEWLGAAARDAPIATLTVATLVVPLTNQTVEVRAHDLYNSPVVVQNDVYDRLEGCDVLVGAGGVELGTGGTAKRWNRGDHWARAHKAADAAVRAWAEAVAPAPAGG